MTRKQLWKATSAATALFGMMTNTLAVAAEPAFTQALSTGTAGAAVQTVPGSETPLGTARKIALLRSKVKYVFVLFQENRSFDHYFGTYPGANGLTSTFPGAVTSVPANQTASYTQNIRNTDGTYGTVTPFLAPRTIQDVNGNPVQLYPESIYSVDHSHTGMVQDLHVDAATASVAKNDAYALDQEGLTYKTDSSVTTGGNVVTSGNSVPPTTNPPTTNPSLAAYQKGLVVMAHVDCDTVPFMWHYADVGTLFDNLHQTTIGPSTPGAIALLAAQTGATQWALHPATTGSNTTAYTVPNETDSAPFPGSTADTYAGKPPYGPDEAAFATCAVANTGALAGTYNNLNCPAPATNDPARGLYTASAVQPLKGALSAYANGQLPLTFASLPLSMMGSQAANITAQDTNPAVDLSDVQDDLTAIASKNPAVSWGWYQQGFGAEPFDGTRVVDTFPVGTPHSSYIVHHNGPQYFGYLGDNPAELANMHGLQQFYTDVNTHALPAAGGVFYVRGGYYNNDGLTPLDPSPAAQAEFNGNDDHGSYSDSQISEASIADSVNAIANSPYWSQSAIIITYDETDGFYDHVPEEIRNWGPDGEPMSGGPRIPTILLSPYMAAHTVNHNYSEHGSIVRLINSIFGLTPLSALPDEERAKKLGAKDTALNSRNGAQKDLGPNDGGQIGEMLDAFDNDRLLGRHAPVAASVVTIPSQTVLSLPHYGGAGCAALNITPTDYPNGYGIGTENDAPPQNFNPRPTVAPGIPYTEQTILSGQTTSPWTP